MFTHSTYLSRIYLPVFALMGEQFHFPTGASGKTDVPLLVFRTGAEKKNRSFRFELQITKRGF